MGATIFAILLITSLALSVGGQPPAEKPKFTNRLAKETSPYLLMHSHNPTNWYAWGPEAFEKAKKEGQTHLSVHRLQLLLLVPRHGT